MLLSDRFENEMVDLRTRPETWMRSEDVTRPFSPIEAALPKQRRLYYGGQWHEPLGGYQDTINPATGTSLGRAAQANAADVDAATRAAQAAFAQWRQVKPRARGALLK